MVKVAEEKCIVCGLCKSDCSRKAISIEDGKLYIRDEVCNLCGHCVAICPQDAVTIEEADMDDVESSNLKDSALDPDALLRAIKGRRSVRFFKDQAVEQDKIDKIIQAGRYTPTSSNNQGVSYVVIQDRIQELRLLGFEGLKMLGESTLADPNSSPQLKNTAKKWIAMHDNYHANPEKDRSLFYNSSLVIAVVCDSEVDGSLAASNMELMVYALGLGMLYSGFLTRAAKASKKLRDFLQVPENKKVVTCLVIGYPDIDYQRTCPRKKAEVLYM